MGRRSKLTPEVHQAVVGALRLGASVQLATKHAGIGATTYHSWLKRGGREEGPYRDFRDDVQKARADCALDALQTVNAAMSKTWQAAAWLLERRHGYRKDATFHLDTEEAPPRSSPQVGLECAEESAEEYFSRQLVAAEQAAEQARERGSWQAAVNSQRMAVALREKLDVIRATNAADFAVDDADTVAAEIRELLAIPAIAAAFEKMRH